MIGELFDLEESAESRSLLHHSLAEFLGELPCNGRDSFAQAPVLVSPDYLANTAKLCRILNKAIIRVVTSYFSNEQIRSIYQLDDELENILRMASGKPYQVGLYRPDFLQGKDGQSKICEIGARYPINGWMISYYLNIISQSPDFLYSDKIKAIPKQTSFVDTFCNRFLSKEPVVLLHDNEKGTEVFYLLEEFARKNIPSCQASPRDLRVMNDLVYLGEQAVSQFIFEMDREELRKFDLSVLEKIIRHGNYFNDVRTLILVHDKRILAVLYDKDIMAQYLDDDELQFLRSFLIPTYALNHPEKREELIHTQDNWLIKQNSGGRGIGIYVKNECSPEFWAKQLNEHWNEYMAQEYVPQLEFDYKYNPWDQPINLVGMLLCYNDESFGPGLFRGSAESVINVHQGRGIIFPAMLSER